MEHLVHQLLVTLCVTSSLSLVALGSSDPIDGFCLLTLSFGRPTAIMGLGSDTVAVSHDA
jgi:hypothetical protein